MTTREDFLADAEAAHELQESVRADAEVAQELQKDAKSEEDRAILAEMQAEIEGDSNALAEARANSAAERRETLSTLGHQALLPGGITAPLEEVRREQEAGHDMAPGSAPHSR